MAATISPGASDALHAHGRDEHAQVGEAAPDDVEHVAQGRARGRGHDADGARKGRQRALAGGVEQALGLELLLELLEGELERARALGLEQLDDELVLPAVGVDVEAAEGEHLEAVLGLEAHAPGRARGRARTGAGRRRPSG